MPALQLIVLVALTRASKMDSAPNFEMAFREIKTNWKGNPQLDRTLFFMISWQFAVTKMISAQKALPIEFTKYTIKFDRKMFKHLINEGEYSTFLQEWMNKTIGRN